MGKTLSQAVSDYRTTQQAIQSGQATHKLTSLLNIGGQLYAIKDPAVEQLASEVESRLSNLEGKSWTEVTKGNGAAKFTTSVTQGTDGQITVTYGTIRDAALTDTSETNKVVKGIAQTIDGVVTATMGQVAAGEVSFNETNWNATDAKAAILEALSKAIGDSNDLSSANTINAAKKYADELVNNLAGADWATNAKKVQEIIAELENSDNANAWTTAIDKLAGLDIKYTQAEADAYNANLTGAISTETTLTAEQAATLNGLTGVSSTEYTEGSQPNAEDVALYNSKLTGAVSTSTVKTPQTVKQYVDAKVATIDVSSQIASAIADLDATVGSTTVASGKHVAVQVVEADGVLTGVTVTEDDIASAQDLEDLTNTVEEHAEVTAAALNDLDSRITAIDLTTKANKAAITTGTINNWTSSYTAGTETLSWSNTETTVYVPVSGQSL